MVYLLRKHNFMYFISDAIDPVLYYGSVLRTSRVECILISTSCHQECVVSSGRIFVLSEIKHVCDDHALCRLTILAKQAIRGHTLH